MLAFPEPIIIKALLLAAFAVLVSCGGQKETAIAVVEAPAAKKQAQFERITFSIFPGFSSVPNSKDVEILEDGTFYYRLRERYCCQIEANYTGVLDSVLMFQVRSVLASIDFNRLKIEELTAEHESYISARFNMANGEVHMVGTPKGMYPKLAELLNIIESQKFVPSKNRHFSTAKDVTLPPPPGHEYDKALLDSL
ncbi:hypothetical protein [uncultured Pontibacter sp.]|uniref:hypothetical protein n=1 Tax=uncultured Pontibacter sp. TaxID=453356 RepID=UPI00260D0BEC|nr:hypothetical protein [uncultured Pontibacter sp.]